MGKPRVTSAAERDYTAALKWYAERSLQAADRFEAEFDRAMGAIAANPERYPLCDDRHRFYLMDRFPFQVIYREHPDGWFIIAVAHAMQHPGFWHGR